MDGKLKKAASIFILISVGVFLSRCQQEENEAPDIQKREQNKAVTAAKKWFENSRLQLEALAFTETIDWNNAIVTNGEMGRTIEVPLILKPNTNTNVVTDEDYKTHMRLLFVPDIAGQYKVYDIVYTTKDYAFDNTNREQNFYHIDPRYSGYITIQDSQNKIIYSGEFVNGMVTILHNLSRGSNETSRTYCRYWVYVGSSVNCSSWVWEPDYGSGYNWGPPGMSGAVPRTYFPSFKLDPCGAAKTTTGISAKSGYLNAKSDIMQASADGKEHSITLGNGTGGALTQAPMNNGGTNGVKVNQNWPGAFAAMHNHPNNSQVSAGDIYAAVTLNTTNSNFTTSFIFTEGQTYAIVITNLTAAKAFVTAYPADISPIYPPEFPDVIFSQLLALVNVMGSSVEGKTNAIAFTLDKFKSGITLLKQEHSGEFKPINFKEITQANGSKSYNSIPCN
ncbi:hypothetical protein D0809_08805 [Flavobacterium circumlabens]|uniref:Uncharacterized protein n=1 Tax=Flavobacterium circumlabens TaxID=2133765 RepID=A0A4Y7UFU7_9FLAO|nr:hypothetical protein [Flavobacterium circumlabens]TCN60017.1 hypothetical protein EV142_102637 [Flavobacterium circumlabens]TEB45254.1 hypothetical protein D0809_08805 [Flavobacterium circumlabens]